MVRSERSSMVVLTRERGGLGLLECGDPFLEFGGDLLDGLRAVYFIGAEIDDGLQEAGAADSEADEAGDGCGNAEPVEDFLFVFAPAEDDACGVVATAFRGGGDDGLAVFAAVEAFDFPDVGIDAGVLQGADGGSHEGRAQGLVVGSFVIIEGGELFFFGRDEQLEHEEAFGFGEIIGDGAEALGLAGVHCGVAFGVVADEDLDEGWIEGARCERGSRCRIGSRIRPGRIFRGAWR